MVLDVVGGDAFTDSLRCLAELGRLLVVGFAAGQGIPEVKVNRLLLGNLDVRGVGWGGYAMTRPSYMHDQWRPLLPMIESGRRLAARGGDVRRSPTSAAPCRTWRPDAPSGRPSCACGERGAPPRLTGMSTLEDAREGMDPDIRPQDDLFGHVNGRWLETAEIPADKGSWGSFVNLADAAEEQVRAIIEGLAERVANGEEGLGDDAMRIACLYASFMDEEAVEARGVEPLQPLLDAVGSLRDVRDLAAFLGEFEQIGGSGVFGIYVDVDGKNSDRTLFNVVAGRPRPARRVVLPRREVRRDPREVRRLPDPDVRARRARRPGRGAASTVVAVETRLSQGHWERAETRDVQKTYNLLTVEELHALCPAFDWEAFIRNLGGSEETIAETCIRQPSYLEHLSAALEEVPIEDWRAWLVARVIRAYAPYLTRELVETNFDFYGRTLGGTPELRERWKRGVALVEGSIGEAVGREYVARHFPPDSKAMMEDAGRQPAAGLPAVDLGPGLDERGDQAGGVRQARPVPLQDRLPGEVPRLLLARLRPRRPARQRRGGERVRDPPAAGEDRRSGRPRRVADAAPDGERLLPARA